MFNPPDDVGCVLSEDSGSHILLRLISKRKKAYILDKTVKKLANEEFSLNHSVVSTEDLLNGFLAQPLRSRVASCLGWTRSRRQAVLSRRAKSLAARAGRDVKHQHLSNQRSLQRGIIVTPKTELLKLLNPYSPPLDGFTAARDKLRNIFIVYARQLLLIYLLGLHDLQKHLLVLVLPRRVAEEHLVAYHSQREEVSLRRVVSAL